MRQEQIGHRRWGDQRPQEHGMGSVRTTPRGSYLIMVLAFRITFLPTAKP